MLLSEHVRCVSVTFKTTERAEQWVCIRFCVKLEHSSTETIQLVQKAAAMGNWWLAASSRQNACSCITSPAEFCGKTSNHPGDSALQQPRFGALRPLAFPKTKITFERSFRKLQWGSWWQFQQRILQGILNSRRDAGRTVWGPKVPTLKGTGASLPSVQCFLYLVSSSIKVSIFHITWLDTFWTHLVEYMIYSI